LGFSPKRVPKTEGGCNTKYCQPSSAHPHPQGGELTCSEPSRRRERKEETEVTAYLDITLERNSLLVVTPIFFFSPRHFINAFED